MYGGIALRHELSNVVMWLGHIGYGIRPSARRHGLATWTLGRMLDEARELGLNQMRIICEADNLAPGEEHRAPGRRPCARPGHRTGTARRYWIKIGEPGESFPGPQPQHRSSRTAGLERQLGGQGDRDHVRKAQIGPRIPKSVRSPKTDTT